MFRKPGKSYVSFSGTWAYQRWDGQFAALSESCRATVRECLLNGWRASMGCVNAQLLMLKDACLDL